MSGQALIFKLSCTLRGFTVVDNQFQYKNDISNLQSHKCLLIPKGPNCVFWQHRNFGQVSVTRDFHIFSQTLIEGVDEEYLSCALNFRTFENMSKKLWPNM